MTLRKNLLPLAVIASLALSASAQTSKPLVPKESKQSGQVEPWQKIPIPPLAEFHPVQPKRIQLENGAVIFLQEDHELPFITGFVEMRGGERDVPAAKAGLIGLYGDAWRTSGTESKTGDQLDDLLEAKAAKVETSGDIDSTAVSWSCLKKDEDQVFGIAVDLLLHPKFAPDKLKLAQQQAAAGIVRRNDDASGIAAREAMALVYGKQNPYARQPELATVLSVTVADLKAWHDKTVAPNNMIIGVEGDFDSAAMEKALRAAFAGLPRGQAAPPAPTDFHGPTPGLYFVNKSDVNQSNVWVVGLGTERNNPDYYALSVMNEIFSGGFGSRLVQDVRTKQGLAYEVGGAYGASWDHPGVFEVTAATKSQSTEKTTKALLDEIDQLKTQPVREEELKAAKDQLMNSFIFNYDSPAKVLSERVKLEFYGYPADYVEKYQAGVKKVTVDDVNRVAKKYIDASKLAVLVVGNESEFQTPLSALNLGPAHPIDITIPMPPGMRGAMGGNEQ
jgi:zinc protease